MSKRKLNSLDKWVIKKPKEKPEGDSRQSVMAGSEDVDRISEFGAVKGNGIAEPCKDSTREGVEEIPPKIPDNRTKAKKKIGKLNRSTVAKMKSNERMELPTSSQREADKRPPPAAPKKKHEDASSPMTTKEGHDKATLSRLPTKKINKRNPSVAAKSNSNDLKKPLMSAQRKSEKLSPPLAKKNKTVKPSPSVAENDILPPPKKTKTRSLKFQIGWLTTFPWCQLNEERTKLLCGTCRQAHQRNLFTSTKKLEMRFISQGYSNWKDATTKLRIHEESDQHVDATTKLDLQKKQPIAPIMINNLKKSQHDARIALRAIITSIRYLTQQGLAIRGHDHQDGNFRKLLQLRSNDIPELSSWLKSNSTYTSMDCQNEIIRIISQKVQRQILQQIQQRKEFCLIIDETSDLSGKEQVSMCVRTVDEDLLPHENFLGLYQVGSTTGEDLTNVVLDFLQRSGLSVQNLRGQRYDGAKNMSGVHRGVAKRIADKQPLAVFVHCYAHSLNLAIQDTVKKIPLVRDTLSVVHEISTIVKASPKRLAQFKDIASQQDCSTGLVPKPLCPTRFIHRVRSIRAILENYEGLLEQLEILGSSHEQVSSSANGLLVQLLRGEVYFAMILCLELFKYLETLSRQIQKPTTALSAILEAVNLVKSTLAGHSEDEELFQSAFKKMQSQIQNSSLEEPKLPRYRKLTAKVQKSQAPAFKTVQDYLRSIYQSAYKLAKEELNFRFSQDGVSRYIKMENMILNPGDPGSQDIQEFCQLYSLNADRLETNLKTLKFSGEEFQSLGGVVEYMRGLQPQSRALYKEVIKVIKLLLLFPVSSCTAERSFSVMKLVKTHLRTTMIQERLNHCVIIHTYADLVDHFDEIDIMREFVNNERRVLVFGEV